MTSSTTGAHNCLPPHTLPLELPNHSETDALLLPNQILKRFVKKYLDSHQKFPVEKIFLSRSKIFFVEVENFQRKINENQKLRFSKISVFIDFPLENFWKISTSKKIF